MGKKKRSQPEQLTFGAAMGIRRKGGGCKKDPGSGVSHLKREPVSKHAPLHVNSHLVDDLPDLRSVSCLRVIVAAIREARERAGRRDDGEFRIVEYSVQSNHLHLMVEAGDADALARGVAGLKIRIAKALNRLWGRRGKVCRIGSSRGRCARRGRCTTRCATCSATRASTA